MRKNFDRIIFILMLAASIHSCKQKGAEETILFKALGSKETGIDFYNKLAYDNKFNLFKYMYFYNGSGVGAADFNNDGLIDLFFGSNRGDNKLYLNTASMRFKDISQQAGIPRDGGWTTGISVVDINNDGLQDIYVCRVGNYEVLQNKNQLLINQGVDKDGIPHFVDKAEAYGLHFSGFSTQAAFFDYDMDGDLDMFLLNHSVQEINSFRPRKDFVGTYHQLSGHRLFRNDGGIFADVTKDSKINSSAIGYGLGIAVSDINLDGWPDIYIGNDFHEADYLYINQHNGTFTEEVEQRTMHTSQFSMGVDVADINNDGFPEIISTDMLPADPYILKRSLGEDAYDIFNYKISVGYPYQYTRNNLQYNRRNGLFSEVGLYSGIAATDWSWAPLWVDFDNDGLKDLFISNGIPKRMNDIDYINFVAQNGIQQNQGSNSLQEAELELIDKFPEIKLPNKFFINKGHLSFTDRASNIEGNEPSFSNGAVYADLDNDGDLDIVVNNIDATPTVYENQSSTTDKKNAVVLMLKGHSKNSSAIGAKAIVYAGNEVRTYEKFPAKGFLSSMDLPILIGTKNTTIDSILLVWPDNTYQKIPAGSATVSVHYQPGLPRFNYTQLTGRYQYVLQQAQDITDAVGISYLHHENHFVEFDREPLLPHMISTEGPALDVADVNGDGLQDVFIGSARGKVASIFLQQPSGKFIKSSQPTLEKDSVFENTGACFTDVNNDGKTDLVIASGGNEFFGQDNHNTPRVYLNDGKAWFSKLENAFPGIYLTASCIAGNDVNGDGYVDLFIGARAVPWEYGQTPASFLLLNDKAGKFIDATKSVAPALSQAGFVTSARWHDMDKDGDKDLLLSLEWGGIDIYLNDKGSFSKKTVTDKNGWWNFVLPFDIDNDGDIDLLAGNLGLNSRLKVSDKEPLRLYYNDFDGNGKKEQVFTYYLEGKEIPFASKAELEKQMPVLKKKFLYAGDFAKASLKDLFGTDKLNSAQLLTANYMSSAVFINKGNLQFDIKELPFETQFSPMKDAVIVNANNDSLPDILIAGNYYGANIQMGRYDADYGSILINKGQGNFVSETMRELSVKGQVRHIKPITIGNQQAYILARNNDSALVFKFIKATQAP